MTLGMVSSKPAQAPRRRTPPTVTISTWAMLAMLAEALELAASAPDGAPLAALLRLRIGQITAGARTPPPPGAIPGVDGWRRWEAWARAIVSNLVTQQRLPAARQAMISTAGEGLALTSPAAGQALAGAELGVGPVASAAIRIARQILIWVRTRRMPKGASNPSPKPAPQPAPPPPIPAPQPAPKPPKAKVTVKTSKGGAGAVTAAGGAAAGAAGATAGASIFAPHGALHVPTWPWPMQLAAGAAAGWAVYRYTRRGRGRGA